MKLDRTIFAILIAGACISGAILLNGHLDRAAADPARLAPSRAEVTAALERACPLYVAPPKNVVVSPTRGTEVTGYEITKVVPSNDGLKVRVSLTYRIQNGKEWKTEFVLERDEFGRYVGTWQHDQAKTYVVVAD